MIGRVILIISFILFYCSAKSQGNLSLNLRNFDSFSVSLDITKQLNEKVYVNTWSAYQSNDRRYLNLSSYFTSLNTVNYKVGRVTVGTGYQYYQDYRYNFKYHAWIGRVSIKLF